MPKLRAGVRKCADAETVTGGLILPEGHKIEEIWVELSLEPISFDSAERHDLSSPTSLVASFMSHPV